MTSSADRIEALPDENEAMMTADGSIRPWRTIARELARENDAKRILELSEELTEAVQAQGLDVECVVPPISETLRPKANGHG